MKRFLITGVIALTAMIAMPVAATAAPIVGSIQFGGNGNPVGAATWYQSTGVNFINPWLVTAASGDYAGTFGATATFSDINYGGGSGVVNVPVGNIWTFTHLGTTYTLQVATATNINRGVAANDNISVNGNGTLTMTGVISRDPTPGTWNFTAGFTTGGVPNLSFSAGAVPVPEPALMALFGLGLAAAGTTAARRRRKD